MKASPSILHSVPSPSPSSSLPARGGPFATRIKWLRDGGRAKLIRHGLRGVEKESLRVSPDGTLSRRPHPKALGATLTHPYITTDYSEALPELESVPPILKRSLVAAYADLRLSVPEPVLATAFTQVVERRA